jgi:hypothetical protein
MEALFVLEKENVEKSTRYLDVRVRVWALDETARHNHYTGDAITVSAM